MKSVKGTLHQLTHVPIASHTITVSLGTGLGKTMTQVSHRRVHTHMLSDI